VNTRYVDYINHIHESGRHLLDVINDILDVSRIEVGKLELQDEEVDLAQLVDSTLRLAQTRAGPAGLTINREIPDNLPGLSGDARRLKQVLLNLLSNAIKFTHPG
ncbi:MAG: sensor histidine kinase, partial [Alphaproteobacteria bacterium]